MLDRTPKLILFLVCALAVVAAPGCAEDASDNLWDDVISIEYLATGQMAAARQGAMEQAEADATLAQNLDRALERNPDADEDLRRVVEELRDGIQQLANGEITGNESDALREQHASYWEHLRGRELPPEFQ